MVSIASAVHLHWVWSFKTLLNKDNQNCRVQKGCHGITTNGTAYFITAGNTLLSRLQDLICFFTVSVFPAPSHTARNQRIQAVFLQFCHVWLMHSQFIGRGNNSFHSVNDLHCPTLSCFYCCLGIQKETLSILILLCIQSASRFQVNSKFCLHTTDIWNTNKFPSIHFFIFKCSLFFTLDVAALHLALKSISSAVSNNSPCCSMACTYWPWGSWNLHVTLEIFISLYS